VAAKRPGEGAASDPTKRSAGSTVRARALRKDDTEAEYRFWGELRGRRLNGYKFVRQIPLGPFVVDFLCRERLLVVELDGGQHAESRYDVRRTTWLNAQGYSVLRFWNDEILHERRAVLDTLLAVLDGRIHAPSPGLRFAPATLSPPGRGGRQSRPRHRSTRATKPTATEARRGEPAPAIDGEMVSSQRPAEGA
jgi:very-short-patch-repair endonuclease